jgi:hypothetical protein
MCPRRQATWAGDRAGPPVSVHIVQQAGQEAVLGRLSPSVCLWWALFFVHLFFFLHISKLSLFLSLPVCCPTSCTNRYSNVTRAQLFFTVR